MLIIKLYTVCSCDVGATYVHVCVCVYMEREREKAVLNKYSINFVSIMFSLTYKFHITHIVPLKLLLYLIFPLIPNNFNDIDKLCRLVLWLWWHILSYIKC